MTPDTAMSLGGAFVFGLGTSLHCVGMCGPVACVACQGRGCSRLESAVHYQVARLAAYTLCGALAGGFGWLVAPWLRSAHWLPWAGAAAACAAALLLFLPSRRATRPRWFSGRIAPGWIGLATPLLPCGPLYLMLGMCGLSESAARGATLALLFGMGTLPLLWLTQHQWERLRHLVGARGALFLQRGLLAAAVLVLLWRLLPGVLPGPACCQPPAS